MPAFSGNWVAKSKWKSTLPADGPTWTRALCETRHSEKCFDKSDKDVRHYKIENDNIVIDAAGSQAADTADTQVNDDNKARADAKGPREITLQQCVRDTKKPILTPDETKQCLKAIVRELLGDKVKTGDIN